MREGGRGCIRPTPQAESRIHTYLQHKHQSGGQHSILPDPQGGSGIVFLSASWEIKTKETLISFPLISPVSLQCVKICSRISSQSSHKEKKPLLFGDAAVPKGPPDEKK